MLKEKEIRGRSEHTFVFFTRIDRLGETAYYKQSRYAYYIPFGEAEGLLEVMNRLGVDSACIHHILGMGPDYKLGNDIVANRSIKAI